MRAAFVEFGGRVVSDDAPVHQRARPVLPIGAVAVCTVVRVPIPSPVSVDDAADDLPVVVADAADAWVPQCPAMARHADVLDAPAAEERDGRLHLVPGRDLAGGRREIAENGTVGPEADVVFRRIAADGDVVEVARLTADRNRLLDVEVCGEDVGGGRGGEDDLGVGFGGLKGRLHGGVVGGDAERRDGRRGRREERTVVVRVDAARVALHGAGDEQRRILPRAPPAVVVDGAVRDGRGRRIGTHKPGLGGGEGRDGVNRVVGDGAVGNRRDLQRDDSQRGAGGRPADVVVVRDGAVVDYGAGALHTDGGRRLSIAGVAPKAEVIAVAVGTRVARVAVDDAVPDRDGDVVVAVEEGAADVHVAARDEAAGDADVRKGGACLRDPDGDAVYGGGHSPCEGEVAKRDARGVDDGEAAVAEPGVEHDVVAIARRAAHRHVRDGEGQRGRHRVGSGGEDDLVAVRGPRDGGLEFGEVSDVDGRRAGAKRNGGEQRDYLAKRRTGLDIHGGFSFLPVDSFHRHPRW